MATSSRGRRRQVPTVAVADVLAWGPCEDYDEARIRQLFGRRRRLTGEQILGLAIPAEDRWWAALHEPLLTQRQMRLLAADVAEHVVHYYEEVYPGDERPRAAIDAARQLSDAARAAASDAASDAARAAAWAAAWAANAARAAACAAAWAAAWAANAASDAASDAARAAACAAAWAASDAAWAANATRVAERKWQINRCRAYLRGKV